MNSAPIKPCSTRRVFFILVYIEEPHHLRAGSFTVLLVMGGRHFKIEASRKQPTGVLVSLDLTKVAMTFSFTSIHWKMPICFNRGGALVSKSCPTVARGDRRLQMCTSSVEDGDVNLARPASPDMLREDADQPARCRQSFVEEIRGNSLNRIPQVQKLRFSLSGHRTSDTSELVHRSAADLALDDRDYGPVNHRKFEGHPVSVVPYHSAPLERHRRSSIPGLTKLRPFEEERHRELSDAARQSPCHRDRRAAS